MTRAIKKKWDQNPFVDGIPMASRKRQVLVGAGKKAIVDRETGEAEDVAQIVKFQEVDPSKFIKVFTENIGQWFGLKPSGHKINLFIMETMQETIQGDQIYINYHKVSSFYEKYNGMIENKNHKMKMISKAAYHRAIEELIEKDFIARTEQINMYFLNPNIYFNGDRARFAMEIRKKKKSKQDELEEAGQGNLLEAADAI